MGMGTLVLSFVVIIDQIHVVKLAICKSERDTPVPVNADRTNALEIAGKPTMQPEARDFEIGQRRGGIHHGKDIRNAPAERPFEIRRIAFVEFLEAFIHSCLVSFLKTV